MIEEIEEARIDDEYAAPPVEPDRAVANRKPSGCE
jgi:hypothetical protein